MPLEACRRTEDGSAPISPSTRSVPICPDSGTGGESTDAITVPPLASSGDRETNCAPASSRRSVVQRQRSKPRSFEERLVAEKMRLAQQAEALQPGPAKEKLLQKIDQIETASRLDKWLSSPGLQSPR